jgi:hypothetical protein
MKEILNEEKQNEGHIETSMKYRLIDSPEKVNILNGLLLRNNLRNNKSKKEKN